MTCVRADELVKAELGELTVNRMAEIDRHTAACSLCAATREEIRLLISDLSQLAAPTSAESFVDRVMKARATCAPSPTTAARPRKAPVRVAVFAAAAVVLVGVGLARLVPNPSADGADRWTARGKAGRSAETREVVSEVLLARRDKLLLLSGASLGPVDRFAVRYVNRSDETQFLAAFAVDSAGTVHWIFPEYSDQHTDPSTLPLPRTSRAQLLPQVVAPDRPAKGPMHVIAMTSPRPATVKQIEGVLSSAARGTPIMRTLESRFPESSIQEWSCLWSLQQDETPASSSP